MIHPSELGQIPPGRWAIGVSGGADSVALLFLTRTLPGLYLHIVHLDHQTRGDESAADARFVAELAKKLSVPATLARRDEVLEGMADPPRNPSARYRAIRLELFRRVVESEKLNGVLLAHHADDQVETVLLRLLRGSGPAGLGGMKPRTRIRGLTVLRPLLSIRGRALREYLNSIDQQWREDPSNQSDHYARNRVRRFLASRSDLHEPILALGQACEEYSQWIRQSAPRLSEKFPTVALERLPRMLGRESARRWLRYRGVPRDELSIDVVDRLRNMAIDAATPSRQMFPGGITIRRRGGWISR